MDLERIIELANADAAQERFDFARGFSAQMPVVVLECADIARSLVSLAAEQRRIATAVVGIYGRASQPTLSGATTTPLSHVEDRLGAVEEALSSLGAIAEENRTLRTHEFKFGVLQPIALSIIDVLDGLEHDHRVLKRTSRDVSSKRETMLCDEVGKLLVIRRDELLAVLRHLSIEPFETPLLSPFDGTRHRRIDEVVPSSRAQRGRIAKHKRPGYERPPEAWVVRPQWVDVFTNSETSNR